MDGRKDKSQRKPQKVKDSEITNFILNLLSSRHKKEMNAVI